MMITEKDKRKLYTMEDDDLSQEQANLLLKNNNVSKPSSQIQAKAKIINKT